MEPTRKMQRNEVYLPACKLGVSLGEFFNLSGKHFANSTVLTVLNGPSFEGKFYMNRRC